MAYRFATEEQLDFVDGISSEITAYQQKIQNVVNYIAGLFEAVSPDSGIETRYITGEGRDDEKWRGNLLASSPDRTKVNLLCLSITGSVLDKLDDQTIGGGFDKPITLAIDFFYDWDYGTDAENSEKIFNAKMDAFEYVLEQKRDCLPDCVLEIGAFKRLIKRFENASTHIAKGDMQLKLEGV